MKESTDQGGNDNGSNRRSLAQGRGMPMPGSGEIRGETDSSSNIYENRDSASAVGSISNAVAAMGDVPKNNNNNIVGNAPSQFVPPSQSLFVPLQQQIMQQQQLFQLQQQLNLAQQQGIQLPFHSGATTSTGNPSLSNISQENLALLLQVLQQQQQQQQFQNPPGGFSQAQAISMIAQLLQSGLQGSETGPAIALLQQLLGHQQHHQQQQQQQQQMLPQQIFNQPNTGHDVPAANSHNNRKRPPPTAAQSTSHSSGSGSSDASQQTPAVTASSSDNNNTHHPHRRPAQDTSSQGDTSDDSQKRTETQTSSSDRGSTSSNIASSSDPPSDTAPVPASTKDKSNVTKGLSGTTRSDVADEEEEEEEEAYDDYYEDDGGDEEEEDDSDEIPGISGSDISKEKTMTGTFKIPCRARGMAMDHNPLTAFFLIPRSIQHGEDVICSHPACRKAGVKFRFCSFCETPVAKRNFGRRHTHAGESLPNKQDKTSDEATTSTEAAVAPPDKANSRKRWNEQYENDQDHKQPSKKQQRQEKESDIPKSIGNRRSDDSPSSGETDSTSGSGTDVQRQDDPNRQAVFQNFDPPRQEAWITLLNQRPDSSDRRAMSVWVRKILVVSDIQQPLSRLDDISVSTEEEEGKQNGRKKESKDSSSE